jgi:peptidoglycan hydrolase-like protein with peptidoglycan-binding domain
VREDVLAIQKGVNEIVKLNGGMLPIKEDGRYGPATERAVAKAQHLLGTKVDGIWGVATQKAFEGYIKNVAPAPPVAPNPGAPSALLTPGATAGNASASRVSPLSPERNSVMMGKKTYIVAMGALLGAIGGYLQGNLQAAEAIQLAITALLGMTIRSGVASSAEGILDRVLGGRK